MLIECLLRRPKPTVVRLGTDTYTFTPNAAGAHVADVEDAAHAATLLSIKEGYREYTAPTKASKAKASAPTDTDGAAGDEGKQVSGLANHPGTPQRRMSAKARQARNDAVSAYVDAFGSEPDEALSASEILKAVEDADQQGGEEQTEDTPPAA